jgi:hypothetical protein
MWIYGRMINLVSWIVDHDHRFTDHDHGTGDYNPPGGLKENMIIEKPIPTCNYLNYIQ